MADNDAHGPFVYVAFSGDGAADDGVAVSEQPDGELALSFNGPLGSTPSVSVNGVFTQVAGARQVFDAAVRPMCQRVLRGLPACCVANLSGTAAPAQAQGAANAHEELFDDHSLFGITVRYLLDNMEREGGGGGGGEPTSALRLGLTCFLSDPARPTDLFRNVQEKVPPSLQWSAEEEDQLAGQRFVFCVSFRSLLATMHTVLSAPSLLPFLPNLSFALTIAVRHAGQAGHGTAPRVSRLSLVTVKPEHAMRVPPILKRLSSVGTASDMLSRAFRRCRLQDCVVIASMRPDAPTVTDGGAAWQATQHVLDCLVELQEQRRAREEVQQQHAHQRASVRTHTPVRGTPHGPLTLASPSPRVTSSRATAATAQSPGGQSHVKVDVNIHVQDKDNGNGAVEDVAVGVPTAAARHLENALREAEGRAHVGERRSVAVESRSHHPHPHQHQHQLNTSAELTDPDRIATAAKLSAMSEIMEEKRADVERLTGELSEVRTKLREARAENSLHVRALEVVKADLKAARQLAGGSAADTDAHARQLDALRRENAELHRRLADAVRQPGGGYRGGGGGDSVEAASLKRQYDDLSRSGDQQMLLHHAVAALRDVQLEEEGHWGVLLRVEGQARTLAQQNLRTQQILADLKACQTALGEAEARAQSAESALRAADLSRVADAASHRAEVADLLSQIQTISAERDRRTQACDRLAKERDASAAHAQECEKLSAEAGTTISNLTSRVSELQSNLEERDVALEHTSLLVESTECKHTTLLTAKTDLEREYHRQNRVFIEEKKALQDRIRALEITLRETPGYGSRSADEFVVHEREPSAALSPEPMFPGEAPTDPLVRELEKRLAQAEAEIVKLEAQGVRGGESPGSLDLEWAAERDVLLAKVHDLTEAAAADPSGLGLRLENTRMKAEIESRDTAILQLKDKLAKATKAKGEAEKRERQLRRALSGSGGNMAVGKIASPPSAAQSSDSAHSAELGSSYRHASPPPPSLVTSPAAPGLGQGNNNNKVMTGGRKVGGVHEGHEVEHLRNELEAWQHKATRAEEAADDALRAKALAINDARTEQAALEATIRNVRHENSVLRKEAQASAGELDAVSDRYEAELRGQRESMTEQWRGREKGWIERHRSLESQIATCTETIRKLEAEKRSLETRLRCAEGDLQLLSGRSFVEEELVEKNTVLRGLQERLVATEAENTRLAFILQSKESEYMQAGAANQQMLQVQDESRRREELLLGQIRTLVTEGVAPSTQPAPTVAAPAAKPHPPQSASFSPQRPADPPVVPQHHTHTASAAAALAQPLSTAVSPTNLSPLARHVVSKLPRNPLAPVGVNTLSPPPIGPPLYPTNAAAAPTTPVVPAPTLSTHAHPYGYDAIASPPAHVQALAQVPPQRMPLAAAPPLPAVVADTAAAVATLSPNPLQAYAPQQLQPVPIDAHLPSDLPMPTPGVAAAAAAPMPTAVTSLASTNTASVVAPAAPAAPAPAFGGYASVPLAAAPPAPPRILEHEERQQQLSRASTSPDQFQPSPPSDMDHGIIDGALLSGGDTDVAAAGFATPPSLQTQEGEDGVGGGDDSGSESDDDDSEDAAAAALKAQLAEVEAQNARLRDIKEREHRMREEQRAGRLTQSQRQRAAKAIRDSERAKVNAGGSPQASTETIRQHLHSLTSQVKAGKFDRKQVDEQLQRVLDAVK